MVAGLVGFGCFAALLAVFVWREWAHDRERQVLLDRIAAPGALLSTPASRAAGASPVSLDELDAQVDAVHGRDLPLSSDLSFLAPTDEVM